MVAVIRRGPTEWCSVGRWDTANLEYTAGAWFHGRIFPQKCDLSTDGRWLAYSAHKHGAGWEAGSIYEAISRLPWLTALAAWEAGSTYGRGFRFDPSSPGVSQLGPPDVGDTRPFLKRHGLKLYRPEQFNVERHRGWLETDDTPPRREGGTWDETRPVELRKRRPVDGSRLWLHVEGSFAGFRTSPDTRIPAAYALVTDRDVVVLDVQWADWSNDGRLLVATSDGRLEVRSGDQFEWSPIFTENLSEMRPDPQPPPAWAYES